ncbi:Tcc2i18.7 [Trypanosoma grayi]|uniref:Tcc2i18.7 n=1 Tax=Trypanosoma grayi TaxID=71804 RepID=UPI0004F3FB9F|nr:Tcc2i18.7 [Trypanosoma grayi]KEG08204.1 Tcc2i18.7 [Trypanosoma grayi]
MPKKGGKKETRNVSDETLDALVAAIEGVSAADSRKNPKQGMTKKQALALDEKKVNEAICKVQGANGMPFSEKQLRMAFAAQRLWQEKAIRDAQYVNVVVPLNEGQKSWMEVAPKKYIRYEQFDGSEEAMNFVVQLFTRELTEPYSSFTYEYFVFGWPDLTVIAYGIESETVPEASVKGERVGAVVSRVTRKGPGRPLRGYVAMFAVVPEFRGFRLGSRLVALTTELMRQKGCEEVYLETPVSNERALSLYLNLGFVKTKFLPRYYLDHSDAVRLKLWLTDAISPSDEESTGAAIMHEAV